VFVFVLAVSSQSKLTYTVT